MIGASPGYGIGKVLIKQSFQEPQEKYNQNKEEALEVFNQAHEEAKNQIEKLKVDTIENIGDAEGAIFGAHLMMLTDPEMTGQIKAELETYEAAYAIKLVRDRFVEMFEAMDNAYFRERSADVKDVCNRLIHIIQGHKSLEVASKDPIILVAEDLTPSDTAGLSKDIVSGFITAVGGKTSHTAIMARTLEIPAIVGYRDILSHVKNDDLIAIDGYSGQVFINPEQAQIDHFMDLIEREKKDKEVLQKLIGEKSITRDQHPVELACNIGSPNDLEMVLKNDGEGIGLFRSEFLYMDRQSMPTEEEQYEAYKRVLETMNPKPVVIRTLDIGGDKQISYMDFPKEDNPFLGYRAIRYCLENQEIFKIQLRALLRASAYGNLKIMFPMISSVNEIRKAKAIIEQVKLELDDKAIAYGDFQVGIMIEIPAAAIMSDLLAKEVDFFSIGTNDLIQYTTAVDRMNEKIADLYSAYHPALLRLIKTVIDNGHNAGIWVGMCGQVASDENLIPILLGMGLDEFSMSPSSLLKTRQLIRALDKSVLEKEVSDVLNSSNKEEVLEKLHKLTPHKG